MNLIAFLSYLIITSITPGPSNILMMNEARKFGFKGSIHFQFGIISGFIILGLITSLLITRIYHWIPMLESYFKIGGAIYLLYLAWKIAFSKKSNNDTNYSQPSFVSGLLFQILNLKSILYFLTAMSTFVLPYHESSVAIFSFMSLTILIGCAGLLLWSICGSAFKREFLKYDKVVNIIMCLLLIYSAITIF